MKPKLQDYNASKLRTLFENSINFFDFEQTTIKRHIDVIDGYLSGKHPENIASCSESIVALKELAKKLHKKDKDDAIKVLDDIDEQINKIFLTRINDKLIKDNERDNLMKSYKPKYP